MACEIWGLDAVAGEAVLRDGEYWLLISSEEAWRPARFSGGEEALRWSLTHRVVAVGKSCSSLDAAVIEARKVCLRAWRKGAFSTEEILRLFAEVERETELARARQRRAGLRPPDWERKLPEIQQAALEMDRYFGARGCTTEESLRMTLLALDLYQQRQGWRQPGSPRPGLFEIGREVLLSQKSRQATDAALPASPGSSFEEQRLARSFSELPQGVLQCVRLWAGSDYDEKDLAILLRIPEEVVWKQLSAAAGALGRSAEQLRTPEVAQAALRVLRSRAAG